MISRRRFLEAGSIAAVAAVSSAQLTAEAAECTGDKLPPAIAALKSRKEEAKPITREERAQRWERARQLMARTPSTPFS